MVKSMGDVAALDWLGQGGILEEVSCDMAKYLLDHQMSFYMIRIMEDNEICFRAMTEYGDGMVLNVSERSGEITKEMKNMAPDKVFYHEDFGSDGCLAYLEGGAERSVYGQVAEIMDLTQCRYYLCGKKDMSAVLQLPKGDYLMIDCGNIQQKIREMPQGVRSRDAEIGHR